MPASASSAQVPRLTYLRIRNYRALRDVELRDLTPLTVLIGPNGSGKSTVLDALAFLAEAVSGNLQQAWEKRNRFAGMRTRGSEGPIEFEVGLSTGVIENIRYKLAINDEEGILTVSEEELQVQEQEAKFVSMYSSSYANGHGHVGIGAYSLNTPEESVATWSKQHQDIMASPDFRTGLTVAINILANTKSQPYPWARALVVMLSSYRYVHLTDDHLKGYSDEGPRERLSANGDNLPNVLYYLHTRHPETLAGITAQLRRWVPQLADVVTEITSDERLLLRFRDAAFEKPLPAQYMSDGTMRLAALLTLLHEPGATGLLGLEEPENELHPQLLPRVAEELLKATETRQLLVATHSPAILDSLDPTQVWILHRGPDGYAQATRTADLPNVPELVEDGSPLGYLWASNSFPVGNPLTPPTAPTR